MIADRSMRAFSFLSIGVALAGCNREPEAAQIRPATETEIAMPATALATAREVPDVLRLDGTLLADEESQLSPLAAGRVVEVLVERGDHVAQDQAIVRLRDTDYRLQQASARATLEQARARLGAEDDRIPAPDETAEVRSAIAQMQLADEQFRRAQELAERGVYSAAQLDEARARALSAREQHRIALQNARSATAAITSARVQLRQASTAVGDSVVRAPFAGEIADRMVSVGEFVAPQTQLVTLVRTDPLRVELEVPQERSLDVRPGQVVRVVLDAVQGRTFSGTVRYVSASVGRQTRSLTSEAVIPNPDGVLRPGMFVEAEIDLGRMRELVAVPPTAILTAAGVNRAFVVREGAIEERVVTIAERNEREILVESGLRAGDRIATENLEDLYDGARLRTRAR